MVQVFAHLSQQVQEATDLALEFDSETRRGGVHSLCESLRRGESLDFHLEMKGLEIEDAYQRLIWQGEPRSVQFEVTIPSTRPAGQVIGKVTICRQTVPIGHIRFIVRILRSGRRQPPQHKRFQPATSLSSTRYNKVFISYASKDRERVLERISVLDALKVNFFQDVVNLDPGERFKTAIFKQINECDLLLLFWSKAASKSNWVLWEVRQALARKTSEDDPPEVRPVILEGPPIVPPPEELRHLHFNDRMRYFIAAESAMYRPK